MSQTLYSRAKYVATGSQDTFTFSFPFISRTHVFVEVNGARLESTDWEWVNDGSIRLITTPAEDSVVRILRETPITGLLVSYNNGAVLTKDDLNKASQQLFYLTQESIDNYNEVLFDALVELANANGVVPTTPEGTIAALVQEVLSQEAALDIQARIDDIDANGQSILANNASIATLQATVDSLTDIDGTGIATFILDEQQARIEGDLALAQDIELIGAANGDNSAFILDLDTVEVTSGTTLGTRLSGIDTRSGDIEASVVSEQSARIDGDTAIADDVALIGVSNGAQSAFIIDSSTVKLDSDSGDTLAETITALEASDTANSASITTLTSVTIPGINSDLTALEAKYGVSLNVNGYVTGFTQFNDGDSGTFAILADKFEIVDPAGGGSDPKAVFTITDGNVFLQNAFIANAWISDLTIDKVTGGDLLNDIGITDGSITLSATGHIKGGQTAYNTGAGFYLGRSGGEYVFSIGDGGANSLTWNGSTLAVRGDLTLADYAVGDEELLVANTERSSGNNSTWTTVKSFRVDRDGLVRVNYDYKANPGVTGTQQFAPGHRLRRDGEIIWTATATSTSWTSRVLDITVDPGTVVEIQYRAGAYLSGEVINLRPISIRNATVSTSEFTKAVLLD